MEVFNRLKEGIMTFTTDVSVDLYGVEHQTSYKGASDPKCSSFRPQSSAGFYRHR
jgi:hypothetical protein